MFRIATRTLLGSGALLACTALLGAAPASVLGQGGATTGGATTGGATTAAGLASSQSVTISAAFSPERLGGHTNVTLAFEVHPHGGELPAALTGIDFHFPADLGLGTSELGQAACDPAALHRHGPKACPANSIMGRGSALTRFQVSPEVQEETATLGLVAGPSSKGDLDLLISATGGYPVAARIVMSTIVAPGKLAISVPLVEGVPEGPDVAVVNAKVTIGGPLTYYEDRHGRRVPYHPAGVLLPRACPKGGFRFSGTFAFVGGSHATADTVVPCPRGPRA